MQKIIFDLLKQSISLDKLCISYKDALKYTAFLMCFVIGLSSNAQTGIEVKLEHSTVNCSSNYQDNPQYLTDVYVRHTPSSSNKYLGSSSIYFSYNHNALNFASYESANFDELTSCYIRDLGIQKPYTRQSFDGKTPGQFLLTLFLQNPTFPGGNGQQACININDTWVKVGSVTFDVLDMQAAPEFAFVGTNGDYPSDPRGTAFSKDNNTDRYKQYFIDNPALSFGHICSNIEQACCPREQIYNDIIPAFTAVEENIIASNTMVNATEDVVFQAGGYIELQADFEVAQKGSFDGYIASCDATVCSNNGNRLAETNGSNLEENDEQNLAIKAYPNPFNSTSTISFNLSQNSNVSVIVYDANGKEIKRLMDNVSKEAGNHQVLLDGRELQKGIYFYTVRVDYKEITKKLMLF